MKVIKMLHRFILHLELLCLLIPTWNCIYAEILEDEGCNTCIKLQDEDLSITTYPKASNNEVLYYRYLMIDEQDRYLYAGAMNLVLKFSLDNISEVVHQAELTPSKLNKDDCILMGKDAAVECQNHIRFIAINTSSSTNELFVCGTGSYKPTGYTLNPDSLAELKQHEGVGWCPFDPFDNATAVFVKTNNPQDVSTIYTATVADVTKSLPVVYRPDIYKNGVKIADFVTVVQDNKWLNEPQFIASFDLEHEVLFFFREVALEYTNCGKKIYSRVARVCKKDLGGSSVLRYSWTSFQKARLNCSIPGSYPYYFDEIQDVYTKDNETFYALFTTNNNGLTASAICAFTLTSITAAFNGPYKAQKNATSIWLPVPDVDVPDHFHPSNCETLRSKDYGNNVQSFIKARTLMDITVHHEYRRPIFYKGNCLMQKLAMEQALDTRSNSISSLVFYTGTNRGEVYKIFVRLTKNKNPEFYISSNFVPFKNGDAIWALKKHNNFLYMGSDRYIKQMDTKTCSKYREIDNCVLDPDCAWFESSNACIERTPTLPNNGYLTHEDLSSISNIKQITEDLQQREQLYEHIKTDVYPGIPHTLPVVYKLCVRGQVTWYHRAFDSGVSTKVKLDSEHRKSLSIDNTLVIKNFTQEDAGDYWAIDNLNRKVSNYTINILSDTKEDLDRQWKDAFQSWCQEFKAFKSQMERCGSTCCNYGN